MIGPLFAMHPYTWPERLAIFATIGLLTYVCVLRRALRADGSFPLDSLIFCECLFLGSLVDAAIGREVEFTWMGLICGGLAGGFVGLIRWESPTEKAPHPPVPAGVWDRELDP